MNKYLSILLLLFLILGGGFAYSKFGVSAEDKPLSTGKVRELTITAKKAEWRFEPEEIEVVHGETVRLTVVNEDDFDHGLAIDAFGVSQRIPANSRIVAEFVVTRAGEFPFYCSVPCGEGEVDGVKRGHFDQVGKIRVVSESAK
jgi:cytochrome c oxidase subunit 2